MNHADAKFLMHFAIRLPMSNKMKKISQHITNKDSFCNRKA